MVNHALSITYGTILHVTLICSSAVHNIWGLHTVFQSVRKACCLSGNVILDMETKGVSSAWAPILSYGNGKQFMELFFLPADRKPKVATETDRDSSHPLVMLASLHQNHKPPTRATFQYCLPLQAIAPALQDYSSGTNLNFLGTPSRDLKMTQDLNHYKRARLVG